MPRPKTISDDDVLAAALQILSQRGADFTLAELGRHVGLSRATLIQRFGDREAILLALARHEVAMTRTWLEGLPVEDHPQALWRFLTEIVQSMGPGDGFSARVAIAAFEAQDTRLRALAGERYALVQDAIAARLPEGPDRIETARLLHAVIAGATMQWVASDQTVPLDGFVLARLWHAVDRKT